jgi:outer membrane biosynthesis protein TonB
MGGFALVGFGMQEPPPDEVISVDMVAMAALGEQPKPNQLDRIVAADTPPPEEQEAASISRVVEKVDQPKPKKKIKKPKKTKKKPKKTKKSKRRKKKRRLRTSDLFDDVVDPRADRGRRIGDPRGHRSGTSTRYQSGVVSAYASRVSKAIGRHFAAPSSLSRKQLNRLKAVIYIKLEAKGKAVAQIKGKPTWRKRSGNSFFDKAAMRAIMKFTTEGGLKIPLPRSDRERKAVLREGFKVRLNGEDH